MQIIGHTNYGYLCQVSKEEMAKSSGQAENHSSEHHVHKIGQIVNLMDVSKHARDMATSVQQRKSAAAALRAVAMIIETVPETFTAPAEENDGL